jgi:hypothetical protein
MKRALAPSAGYIALIAGRKRSRLIVDYRRKERTGGPAARRSTG